MHYGHSAEFDFYLRGLCESDITEVYLETLNDKKYMRFSRNSQVLHNYDSQKNYIESFSSSKDSLLVGVFEKRLDSLVATVSSFPILDKPNACDAGLLVLKPFAGLGLGLIIWKRWITHLTNDRGFTEIYAGTSVNNQGMRRICEDSGMRTVSKSNSSGDEHITYVFARNLRT